MHGASTRIWSSKTALATLINASNVSCAKAAQPQRVWRIEARAGEEVQVDFGLEALTSDGANRPRKSRVFGMVLSYSRKAYSEAVFRHRYAEINLRMKQEALEICQPPVAAASGAFPRRPIWREDAELLKWLKSI